MLMGQAIKPNGNNILFRNDEVVVWAVPSTHKVQQGASSSDWSTVLSNPVINGSAVPLSKKQSPTLTLAMARNELEGLHLVITPLKKKMAIGKVEIADLVHRDRQMRLPSNSITPYLVGYVWENSADADDGFPDVLLPEGAVSEAKANTNYNLYLSSLIPASQASGIYDGQLKLNLDGKRLTIPIAINVWNYTIPTTKSVNTQLFSVDFENIYYTYNLAPWESRAQVLTQSYMERMAQNRFSPAQVPPIPRIPWEKYPTQGQGSTGQGMVFKGNKELPLAGPNFSKIPPKGLTLEFLVKLQGPQAQATLNHLWQNSGYQISIGPDRLVATLGAGSEELNRQITLAVSKQLQANQWHRVSMTYEPNRLSLYLDGKLLESKQIQQPLLSPMRIANLTGQDFAIDEIRWYPTALSPSAIEQITRGIAVPGFPPLKAYNFEGSEFNFRQQVSTSDAQTLASQNFSNGLTWAVDRGLWLNDLQGGMNTDKQLEPWAISMLSQRNLIQRAYVKLPFDETYEGERGKLNRDYSDSLKRAQPQVKRFHTFGTLSGAKTSNAEKSSILNSFVGKVDIWSMRPKIFEDFRTFFQQRMAQGDAISPYIHNTDVVEDPGSLVDGRLFFWKLHALNINSCTYWFTNLWNYPSTRGGQRAMKQTQVVPWGFKTNQRNPSGIAAGVVFWPGNSGILSSLRSEAWRDGIEDYETFKLLSQEIQAAESRGADPKRLTQVKALLAKVQELTASTNTNWIYPTSFKQNYQYYELRNRIGKAIDTLKNSSN
jgi:hypothetical protein